MTGSWPWQHIACERLASYPLAYVQCKGTGRSWRGYWRVASKEANNSSSRSYPTKLVEGKFSEVGLPFYGVLRSSPPYRTLEGRSVRRPAFRNNSTLIPTTHRVISVGKMMVAIRVNPMDSPVYACTRPTGTELTPAITTTHPSHPGYSPLHATARPRRMKVTPAKRMLNRAARAKLMASSARITRRAAAA